MRSLRIFLFLFFVLFVFNANALTTSQRNYLINEKGYTAQQIADYEARIEQRKADRKAGRTPSGLTDEDRRILKDASTPEAIQYGNEPSISERAWADLGERTGWADMDIPSSAFDRIVAAFYSVGGSNGSWFSPIFNTLFNATNRLVKQVNDNLGQDIITILSLLLAFYILFTVTKAVVSFSPIEPSKLFSEIFFPVGRCIIAVWAIQHWQVIFSQIISPLLEFGIVFGNQIISGAGVQSTASSVSTLGGGTTYTTPSCTGVVAAGLDKGVCDAILGFLSTISLTLVTWMAVGATFLAECWGKVLYVLPDFNMLFMGLIIFIFAFMIYVSFPLKLIDALFRLMFVVVLFPLWCAFWVVPQTRKYFGTAVNMFLNVLATFLSASVILVMIVSILASLFNGIDMRRIISLLKEGETNTAMQQIDFSTSGLFYAICLLYMAFHLVSKVDYFANIFVKQDSLGIGGAASGAVTAGITASPKLYGMAKNATKWGVGKTKQIAGGIANRSRAKSYNNNVPGGTARQGPRLWSANPITAVKDWNQARKSLGGYARTGDVSVGKVQKAADGSTSQTYSNATYDKDKNLLARMKETTSSSGNKVNIGGKKVPEKQSVERERTKFDENGNVKGTANVKKDFENGQAVRKTTTMKDKNGNRVDISVDKKTGLATKTKYDASGNKLSTETRARGGERTLETYKPDGTVEKSVKDSDGIERSKSITRTDGSKETFRYSKDRMPDGRAVQFENMSKDASGAVTRHLRVNVVSDTYTDVLTGTSGQWSTYGRGS